MGGRVQPRALERLSTAVSSRRDDALAAWRSAVRDAARARGREPALLDLGPALLGQLLEDPSGLELPPGADPAAVSEELALLREALEALPRADVRGRAPRTASAAPHGPLLEGSPAASAALRTLTAVPLLEQGALVGVLEGGSRTAYQLGQLDELLLHAAARRAGPLLAQEEARLRIVE